MDDIDAFFFQQIVVVVVACDAERAGKGVQLRFVVPGRRDQLRP